MSSIDRCVLVDGNGLIVNLILCDRQTYPVPAGLTLLLASDAPPQPDLPLPVPAIVTPRQLRLALNEAGLRANVEAAVAASDQTIRDAWEYALEFERADPLIISVATALGLTTDDIDAMFRRASTL